MQPFNFFRFFEIEKFRFFRNFSKICRKMFEIFQKSRFFEIFLISKNRKKSKGCKKLAFSDFYCKTRKLDSGPDRTKWSKIGGLTVVLIQYSPLQLSTFPVLPALSSTTFYSHEINLSKNIFTEKCCPKAHQRNTPEREAS